MIIPTLIISLILRAEAFYLPYPMAPYPYAPPMYGSPYMPPPFALPAPPYGIPLVAPPSTAPPPPSLATSSNSQNEWSQLAQAPKAQPFVPPPGAQGPQPPPKAAYPDLLTLKLPLYGSEAVLSDESTKESSIQNVPVNPYGVR